MSKKASAEMLVAAVSNGRLREADSLLASGLDINKKIDGRTALHFAIGSRSVTGFRWLIKHGASINELDKNGLTPLMIACSAGGSKGCQIALELMQAGCDVKVRRAGDGMSALEFAAGSANAEVIRALIDHGADLNGPPGADLFPALLATRDGSLDNLKTLVDLGCDLAKTTQLRWAKGLTCLGVGRLERKKAIVTYLETIGAP